MTLEPVGERIVVKRLVEESRSGIILPEVAKRASLVGRVVAKGPDASWVEIGDMVLFGKYSGFLLPVDGKYVSKDFEDCILMNCEDVLSIVKEGAPQDAEKKEEALVAHG